MRNPRLTVHHARVLYGLAAWLAGVPLAPQCASQDAKPLPGAQEEAWTLPLTAWGDPDLRGTWSYASLTPLQRPGNYSDKEYFSEEEAVA